MQEFQWKTARRVRKNALFAYNSISHPLSSQLRLIWPPMNNPSLNLRLLLLPALLTLVPLSVHADEPGHHPAYLHAMADLRHARAHLERQGGDVEFRWDEGAAIREIDLAIREIRDAAIDDGKNLADHPPVDSRSDYFGRVRRSLELLRQARADCAEEEDNAFARGLRRRALRHIEAAIRLVEVAIRDAHRP